MLKATGMVRKVDMLGRIVIPMELRRTMNIDINEPMEMFVSDNQIILQKYEPGCCFCGHYLGDMVAHGGKMICLDCIKQLQKQAKLDQVISRR